MNTAVIVDNAQLIENKSVITTIRAIPATISVEFAHSIIKAVVILFTLLHSSVSPQSKIDLKDYKNSFALDQVIMIDINDNLYKGYFLELNGDSLKLFFNSSPQSVSLSSIKYLKIIPSRTTRNSTLNLGIAGAFGAQLLMRKNEWQSDRFIQTDGLWSHILVGVLGALSGGLIGLGIDMVNSENVLEFYLQNPKDIERLQKVILQKSARNGPNLYYEISNVYSRVDPSYRGIQGYYTNTENISLNVFRSLKLTFNVSERLEAGLAMYSAAEPNLKYTSNFQSGYVNEEMSNKVYGYYATAFYDLLGRSDGDAFSLKPGLGIGFANLDYTVTKIKTVYDNINFKSTTTNESNNLNRTLFSGFLAFDVRFFATQGVSIALSGDYVFIPERTISSDLPGENGRSLGNFSLGLSLGLHF